MSQSARSRRVPSCCQFCALFTTTCTISAAYHFTARDSGPSSFQRHAALITPGAGNDSCVRCGRCVWLSTDILSCIFSGPNKTYVSMNGFKNSYFNYLAEDESPRSLFPFRFAYCELRNFLRLMIISEQLRYRRRRKMCSTQVCGRIAALLMRVIHLHRCGTPSI